MSVGYAINSGQVDSNAGMLTSIIEKWAKDALTFKEYLDSAPDATLEAPPFNYSIDDIAVLKSGFSDLALLARIYQGNDTLSIARDLGQFSRRMAGLVL